MPSCLPFLTFARASSSLSSAISSTYFLSSVCDDNKHRNGQKKHVECCGVVMIHGKRMKLPSLDSSYKKLTHPRIANRTQETETPRELVRNKHHGFSPLMPSARSQHPPHLLVGNLVDGRVVFHALGAVGELESIVRLVAAQQRPGRRTDDGDLRVSPEARLKQPR